MKYISLFAGIGGFDLALDRLGHECVYTSEWDKHAAKVYELRFNRPVDTRDIKTVPTEEIPEHDLLVGGFPCQAFSIAGKRLGFDDTRGTLFFEIARILKDRQPNFVILENVKGLISHNKGHTLKTILEILQDLGYLCNIEIYNSKDFGVPQNRERIYFVCRHINTILTDGDQKNSTISKKIIQEYLFQILLNNLTEVKKLQETNSKDLVIGYLLLKEINQNLLKKNLPESIKGGISTVMEEKSFQLKEEMWQNIDTLLKNILEESYPNVNRFTTLTVIKQIIESKTYTYTQMLVVILLAIVHLRNSSKNLWEEILSNLILKQENTFYEKTIYREEERIEQNSNFTNESDKLKEETFEKFIVGHLRGQSRPEVFSFGKSNSDTSKTSEEDNITRTITTTHAHSWGWNISYVINQLTNPPHSGQRVYGTDGIAPTVTTGKKVWIPEGKVIRRLTEIECEKLQGFPPRWTEGISSTQRYKCLGNAVTVNVVYEVAKNL